MKLLVCGGAGFIGSAFIRNYLKKNPQDKIVQANLSYSFPGMIRAWHRHHKGQVDYFITVRGATKIFAYDDRPYYQTKGQLDEIISSGEQVQCVRIP